MSALMRVAIVRPSRSGAEKFGIALFAAGFLFLNAWILMLILGAVTPWHLGYWHSLLVIIGLRAALPVGTSGYRFWTHGDGK